MSWAMCGVAHSRGFPGVVLPQFTNPDTDDLYLDPPNLTLFVSIVNAGVMVGSLVTGQLLAPLGGRVVIIIGLPLGVIAWIGLVFSYQLWVLMLCRLLMGFTFALVKPSTVMYIVEVADERIRGRLVGVLCIAREIGFSSSYFMGSLKLTWRQLSLLYGCFLIPPIIALFFIPDSPRWLVARGRVTEACKSLKFFRGCHYDVEVELEGIVSQASAASNSKSSFWQQLKFLARPPTLQTFILLCTLSVIFAFQGIVTITPYLMIILDTPGTPLDPADSAVMCSLLKLSGTMVHIFLIDFIGRKPIFVVFLSYISVCNIVYGFSYTQLQEDSGAAVSWLPLISIGVLHFFSGIIVPVIDLVQGELLPTACRAVSLPLLMLSHSLAVFISLKTFLQMVDTLGMDGVFRLFTLVSLAMAVLTIVAVPETRCLSLEAISNGSNSQARPNTTVSVVTADSHDQRLSKNIVSNQGDNSSSTNVHSHSTHLI
ncbi:solute carrier family 2, facilitated glucose transporter member 6-like [Eriocheir sinensis]|uniref:solute carrier family 2, facilitated glucose transporter member 6-like n=1 Tax=Eriocheir sinensis TaxID=95602 RepID=UPI0021C92690|nr:solute carrier family 2, facilitated glucose transporter member 6-like [Eriocheir sinensis]